MKLTHFQEVNTSESVALTPFHTKIDVCQIFFFQFLFAFFLELGFHQERRSFPWPLVFIYFGKTTSLFYVYSYISTQRPSSFPMPLARRRLSRPPRHREARSPRYTSTHWNRAGSRYQNLQLNRGPQFKTQRQSVFQQPNMLTGYYTQFFYKVSFKIKYPVLLLANISVDKNQYSKPLESS